MHAHTIAQVEAGKTGIHLIWAGPGQWLYSPGGWNIQRRKFSPWEGEFLCVGLNQTQITEIRTDFERALPFGNVILREGIWPVPVAQSQSAFVPCDVFTLELNEPQPYVRVDVEAKESFTFALRDGKVVATGGKPQTSTASYELTAIDIDTVVLYVQNPVSVNFCLRPSGDEDKEWEEVPFIVRGLQMPLKELIPGLSNADDEFSEGKNRLLSGEVLDGESFKRLTTMLHAGVGQHGFVRPIDQVLLLRESTSQSFEELVTVAPLLTSLTHPKWRRVLGFGYFDDDPSLVVGDTYEYRLTGFFPAKDIFDKVYGFHTIPSKKLLPATFYLHDLRFDLPQPATVERAPGTPEAGLVQVSRRAIPLHPQTESWWLWPSIDDWSLVVTFPIPVSSIILELHDEHSLEVAWREPGGFLNGPDPVPAGPRPRLDFPSPIEQLRLRGEGFLFAIRIAVGDEKLLPISRVLPPVTLQDTPRPEPPLNAVISNLQQTQPVPTDDMPPADIALAHALGFEVRWRPAPSGGLFVWPPDAGAALPLEAAIFQIEHRQEPSGSWEPVLPEENWTMGDRDYSEEDTSIYPGADLMSLYPEAPRPKSGADLDQFWRDVFDFKEGGNEIFRPLPDPGTKHRYRVRAVDAVGRPSLTWRDSNVLRLEKHVPPPIPVGPKETPAESLALPEPTGVHARILVKGAPDLTAQDLAVLGSDDNAIILHWGWHSQQRQQDPFAKEFRVYVSDEALDAVPGTLASQSTVSPGVYSANLNLARSVVADAAKDSFLQAGYPFYITTHSAGQNITATLETKVKDSNGAYPVPKTGPILLPLHLTPDKTRPPAWTARLQVMPITSESQYQAVIRNRLSLTPTQSLDSIWVGVSAADDQAYVLDQLDPAETRPGNESAIVPVVCNARYHGRPVFNVPPPIAPVPVLYTPEPVGSPIYFDLDLTPYLTSSGLGAGDLIRPERVSVDAVFSAYTVAAGDRIIAKVVDPLNGGEAGAEVSLPPADKPKVIAALNGADTKGLADHYAVFLAGSHPYRDRLFEAAAPNPVFFGTFRETLPPKSGRYVYRVREADAAGHLSAGSAMAEVVVRVPSLAPGAAPERLPQETGDAPGTLRLAAAPEKEVTHILAFSQVVLKGGGPAGQADILRVPNRPDLYPNAGIRLRTPGGDILAPQVKSLADSDVTTGASGFRQVALTFSAAAGERIRIWACTLTGDGIPSLLGGPWSLPMPVEPLPVPTLSVSSGAAGLNFSWTWPAGPTYNVALQRSPDGTSWTRVSPLLAETATGFSYAPAAGSWHYRLQVMSPDGRTAASNSLTA